jgi:hypothetical protein
LERPEVGTAGDVEGDDLAVQHDLAASEWAAEVGKVGIAACNIVEIPGDEA